LTSGSLPVDSRIREVCDALKDNSLLEVDDLAMMVNLRRSRLDELFKEHTGVRLGDYIRRRRMQYAATLLESTELQIKEIADRVGYDYPPSFTRSFKSLFGMGPSDYRRRHREKS
jgi:two-component system response regulator YesN